MIITNQKDNCRDNQRTKCFNNTFRFIGKMTCYQVGLFIFLLVGITWLTVWKLKSGTETSRLIGSKDGNYGDANEIGDILKDDSSDLEMPRKMLGLIDWTHLSGPELTHRIDEMVRIKTSVQKELHALEAQRREMQRQVRMYTFVDIHIPN